jgi:hypothetical protein
VLSQAVMILSYYTQENNPILVLEAQQWMRRVLSEVSKLSKRVLAPK